MKFRKLLTFLCLLLPLCALAQKAEKKMFNHLNLGITVGSTGLGAEVATPVGDYVRLRTGFTIVPRFKMESNFGVDLNSENINDDKKRRMMDLMKNFTGEEMRDNVDMVLQPTWGNFKFLVDIMPLRNNKHWNLTVGFFAGPARIGKARNDDDATTTLVGVNFYNNFYKKAYTGEPMFKYEDSDGNIHTADLPGNFTEKLLEAGMMGMPLGHFEDGDRAMMVPDANHRAIAEMEVSKFRPYLGIGYSAPISANKKFHIAVDAGALFWGSTPHVYVDNVYKVRSGYDIGSFEKNNETGEWLFVENTPRRIDLTRDVTGINGKVGDWVRIIKKFKCYPMLSLTFSYNIL